MTPPPPGGRIWSAPLLFTGLILALLLGTPLSASASAAAPHAAHDAAHHAAHRSITKILGWSTSPMRVATGSTVDLPVIVTSAIGRGSRPVLLQRQVGSRWSTVARSRTNTLGHAVLTWRTGTTARVVALRVQAPKAAGLLAAVTALRQVTVFAPTSSETPTGPGTGTPDPGTPDSDRAVTQRVLALVNQARASARTCGSQRFPATTPLRANALLADAADAYARLMATRDFFSHYGPDGSDPGDRITAAGYRWRSYGENIAAGQDTPEAVVQAWLDSPGHCANVMGDFEDLGVGYYHDPDSRYGSYWVQAFGTR